MAGFYDMHSATIMESGRKTFPAKTLRVLGGLGDQNVPAPERDIEHSVLSEVQSSNFGRHVLGEFKRVDDVTIG